MKYFVLDFPSFPVDDVNDYHYHFYVESIWGSFVEVSFNDYMSELKRCRKYAYSHHVDVRCYAFRCYNIFLEFKR